MPKTAKKRRKKKGDTGHLTQGAGLVRFFEDETPGIKVGPTLVMILAALLVVVVVIAHVSKQMGLL